MIQLTFGFPPTIVVLHYVSRVESERESLLWGRGRLTGLGPDCFTNTFGVFVCHQYVWWTCVNPMPFCMETQLEKERTIGEPWCLVVFSL